MYRHELANAPRRRGPGVGRGFYRPDVAPYHHGHVAGADVFLADQHDVGRLHHCIGCLDRPDEPFGLDHSQGFEWHASGTLTDCESVISNDVGRVKRLGSRRASFGRGIRCRESSDLITGALQRGHQLFLNRLEETRH